MSRSPLVRCRRQRSRSRPCFQTSTEESVNPQILSDAEPGAAPFLFRPRVSQRKCFGQNRPCFCSRPLRSVLVGSVRVEAWFTRVSATQLLSSPRDCLLRRLFLPARLPASSNRGPREVCLHCIRCQRDFATRRPRGLFALAVNVFSVVANRSDRAVVVRPRLL